MNKQVTALAMSLFMAAATPIISFAGPHGCRAMNQTTCASCTFADCNAVETHEHDGTFYVGHTWDDGHEHHQICNVESCTQTGTHNHDGNTYFEHHDEDGHAYHSSRTSGGRRQHHRSGHHS